MAVVRRDARRLLPQPPGRHAAGDRPHRGRQRALDDRSTGPVGALGRVVQLPAAGQPRRQRQPAGIVDWSPRAAACTCSPPSTSRPTTRPTTAPPPTITRSPGAPNYDGGRAWYTAMGHTQSSFSEPEFRAHILGGIRTAAGTVNADCGAPAPGAARSGRLRDHHARRRHREPDGARRRQGRADVLRRAHHRRAERRQGRRLRRDRRSRPGLQRAGERSPRHRAGPELRHQPQPLHVVHAAAGLLDGDAGVALHAQRRRARPGVRADPLHLQHAARRSAATPPARSR